MVTICRYPDALNQLKRKRNLIKNKFSRNFEGSMLYEEQKNNQSNYLIRIS